MRGKRMATGLVVAAMAATLAVPAAAPGATPAATDPGPVASWTTVTGTDGRVYFADAQGRALQFRGFANKSDDLLGTFSDELLAAGAARGFTLLRVGFFWDELEPAEGVWNEAYLDAMVTVLDRAEAHGFKVILDNHQDSFGEAFGSRGVPAWATRTDGLVFEPQASWLLNSLQPAVQAAWEHLYEDADLRQFQIRAWLKVVERVAGHPALFGYDLLNEPFGKIRDGENLVSAAQRVEATQMTPMYQRLADAIGAVDADSWIFIEPPNLNALGIPTSLGEVTGAKVALYPHMYDPDIELATYTPGLEMVYDPTFFDTWAGAVTPYPQRYPMPVLVGEWGLAEPDAPGMDAFVDDALATLDDVTSGWTMWAACLGGGYCPFDAEGNDRVGIDAVVAPYARAIAGRPTSSDWDRATAVLRVRFADGDAAGPTDIYVPEAKRYPGGFEVRTSDADGTWSHTYDAATGIVSVTTAATGGDHAVCIVPAGSDAPCTANDPAPPPTVPEDPGPAPADPVDAEATFTG